MVQETNQPEEPVLCAMGCGCYGSPRTNAMCSVCYTAFIQSQSCDTRVEPCPELSGIRVGESPPAPCSESSTPMVSLALSQTAATVADESSQTPALQKHSVDDHLTRHKGGEEPQASVLDALADGQERSTKFKQKKTRCFTCHKKVGLTGFSCRCGNIFCSIHRYSDMHSCTFDYKAAAAEKIRKENPLVVAPKIHKI
ncbi:AN1-type zinc finger protein 6-like [Megalops cyprinoides]|uniref:AN1-type zinc finger protein 6-like n=1 Tax=Megalops cyprinoides TaxID=118141 RepID=UPI0018650637|nr:AN1-type zinc finger protein 6-like [Megalops cyprinoides]